MAMTNKKIDWDLAGNGGRRYVIAMSCCHTFSLLRAGVGGMQLVLAWSSLK